MRTLVLAATAAALLSSAAFAQAPTSEAASINQKVAASRAKAAAEKTAIAKHERVEQIDQGVDASRLRTARLHEKLNADRLSAARLKTSEDKTAPH